MYLVTEESHDAKNRNQKEKLKKECMWGLRLVLNTELSAKNKIQATGTLSVPVLRCNFGITDWHQEEL
jgi:hypothetical protein